MTNILYYNYFYRFREKRKQVKNLVDSLQYITARIRLQNDIAEQSNFYPNIDNKKDFNYGEKLLMQHSLNHLNAVINKNDPPFIDENGNLKHQSDIVKEALIEPAEQNN